MARNKQLKIERDNSIRTRFDELQRKNPKWKTVYIFEELKKEFFLEIETLERIVRAN